MKLTKKKKKRKEWNNTTTKNYNKIITKMFKYAIERFWFYKKIGFLFKLVIVVFFMKECAKLKFIKSNFSSIM